MRGLADRALVITPAGLVDQWREELERKFGLPTTIAARGGWEDGDDRPVVLASLAAARRDPLRSAVLDHRWDAVIVDGAVGDVQIRPRPDVEAAYAEKARLRARRQEQYRKLKDVPSFTRDGAEITLQLNAGLLVDLPHLQETGANGAPLSELEPPQSESM